MTADISADERLICLDKGLVAIPERLLLAHARGEVLFICGAGISRPAGLPDFRELVVEVYETLDPGVFEVIKGIPPGTCNQWGADCAALTERQTAEVKRFIVGDYDVVLGMLERRLDEQTRGDSRVRKEVAKRLRAGGDKPAPVHRALIRLADRGGATTIVTTNFDRLLQAAARQQKNSIETYALGAIPRPTRQTEFSGVLHIHGALEKSESRSAELVLSDQDFGEFYLRRRVVPDFIYDAARLYNLVLVGYSANDPPMRYLLNAVAADGTRFKDLKERFTFFGADKPDPVALEDWRARGITPIHYDSNNGHDLLRATLERWSELSAVTQKQGALKSLIKRLVKKSRAEAEEVDRDLFDHLVRRGSAGERARLSALAADVGAELGWLDAIVKVGGERDKARGV